MNVSSPTLVVVSGPPGSGKTWVAAGLRDELRLPLIAKDTLKEVLGEALGVSERPESHRLGGAVFELMGAILRELLDSGVSAIAEGNFSARTRIFEALPPARLVQVHVTAAPDVLRRRLLTRDTHRHPVHYDREAAAEIATRAAAGEWEPLPLDGELIALDTTGGFPKDIAAIASRLQ